MKSFLCEIIPTKVLYFFRLDPLPSTFKSFACSSRAFQFPPMASPRNTKASSALPRHFSGLVLSLFCLDNPIPPQPNSIHPPPPPPPARASLRCRTSRRSGASLPRPAPRGDRSSRFAYPAILVPGHPLSFSAFYLLGPLNGEPQVRGLAHSLGSFQRVRQDWVLRNRGATKSWFAA